MNGNTTCRRCGHDWTEHHDDGVAFPCHHEVQCGCDHFEITRDSKSG
jgi:hypothetical protein